MPLKNYEVPKEKAIDSKEWGGDQNREIDECQMVPATVEIGGAQDLELGGGSQNPMTLTEAAGFVKIHEYRIDEGVTEFEAML